MEPNKVKQREHKVDEALKDSFPASDSPSFVGAGAAPSHQAITKDERGQEQPTDKERARGGKQTSRR
jgi:hypothetical protein